MKNKYAAKLFYIDVLNKNLKLIWTTFVSYNIIMLFNVCVFKGRVVMKKKTFIAIFLIIIFSITFIFTSCGKDEDEKRLSIVYLGDSIAEAVLGPSPICERERYGYFAVLG